MNPYEKHWTKLIGEVSDILAGTAQELDSLPAHIAIPIAARTVKFMMQHRLKMAQIETKEGDK